jgi:hypothetical protein
MPLQSQSISRHEQPEVEGTLSRMAGLSYMSTHMGTYLSQRDMLQPSRSSVLWTNSIRSFMTLDYLAGILSMPAYILRYDIARYPLSMRELPDTCPKARAEV